MKKSLLKLMMTAALALFAGTLAAKKDVTVEPLRISTQQRVPSDLEKGSLVVINTIENWNPAQTAIIICDMWDKHWCNDATA
ncbi:MAG: hypothetical protein LBK97_05725, partial [Prevotellaceae bacterium]|nr:hypothetical protein [Prevotellaceae bacterium]